MSSGVDADAARASAPGKVILFGEHAVVYGRPAIAVPVTQVRARATARPATDARTADVTIEARDLNRRFPLSQAAPDDPLADIVRRTLTYLGRATTAHNLVISVESTIPIASGLGSGAAISTAIARALCGYFGQTPDAGAVSALAYGAELLYHGTPSGIDNTVVAFERPVFFVKGKPIETFKVGAPFQLVVSDTGIRSPTRIAVAGVRERWQADTAHYDSIFDRIGAVATRARAAIETGQVSALGPLMNENQELLAELGVSSPDLERLILIAREAGAGGAKLSGAGQGGNMIALVDDQCGSAVADALHEAGAKGVIVTTVDSG